jgi:hypothetical protein
MKVKIGHINVDSGTVFVGDPCYTATNDASHRIETWAEWCSKAPFDKEQYDVTEPAGRGVGLSIPTFYGDGTYPVYAEIKDGRVASISIDFDEDWEV